MTEEKNKRFEAGQVPVQFENVVVTPKEEPMSVEQALAEILNRLDDLKKNLG